MKTHTIKTPSAELLVVELPETGSTFDILTAINSETEGYTLLGKPDEIREKDARKLVERIGVGDPAYQGDWFVDYHDDEYMYETARESLLSLLHTEIYWSVNPIELEKWENDFGMSGNIITDEWKEAEQKTFDRSRTLLFKKNKQ